MAVAHGDPRAPGAVTARRELECFFLTLKKHRVFTLAYERGQEQTFRESEQVFQRIEVPGPRSCTVAACQSSVHLVTEGHDVVLQLLLNLGNVVSGLVQGCI